MKTVMIVGGAGFIGSHLADAYLRAGEHKVITVDNLSGTPDRNNLQFARNHKNNRHEFYLADTTEEAILKKIISLESPDIVVDCSGNPFSLFFLRDLIAPEALYTVANFENSVLGRKNVIRGDVVFGGRQSRGPVRDVSYKIIHDERSFKKDEDGKKREWTYVADFVRGIKLIVDNGAQGHFTVSSGWVATHNEVCDIMARIAGFRQRLPSLDSEPIFDCSEVRKLGWEPSRSLQECLEATMAWYQLNGWAFRQDS